MIWDSHVHIGAPPSEADPKNFVELMGKSGIDKAVVFRYFYNEDTIVGNQFIRAAVQGYPEHLVGFAWIDPNDESAKDELRTAVLDWGLRGAKIHLEMTPSPIDKLRVVFNMAEQLSIPVIVHLGADFGSIDVLCNEYSVNIIVAHLGTGVYNLDILRLKKALELARKNNIYLEVSGNTFPFIDYTVKALGPSKVIFGSDFPHEHPLVLAKTVELLDLSARDKQLILGKNLMRLIDI